MIETLNFDNLSDREKACATVRNSKDFLKITFMANAVAIRCLEIGSKMKVSQSARLGVDLVRMGVMFMEESLMGIDWVRSSQLLCLMNRGDLLVELFLRHAEAQDVLLSELSY